MQKDFFLFRFDKQPNKTKFDLVATKRVTKERIMIK